MTIRPLTPTHQQMARAMMEAELEELVRQACGTLRLRRFHTLRPKGSPAGFPDDVILGPGGVLYRELKREGKNPTPDQQAWLDGLSATGHDAGVWRPTDWYSGRIMAELRAVSARH